MKQIKIIKKHNTPKYKQIVKSIENAIVQGELKIGDKLPSLNTIKNRNNISRDTVLNAFSELKNRGIIDSTVGKGYFLVSEKIDVKTKVFLLFDELNAFKEDLYNSILHHLGENVQIDVFFHHFNKSFFEDIIKRNIGNYDHYIIMPANIEGIEPIISLIDANKVYILDQTRKEFSTYPSVFQDFENDVYNGLNTLKSKINKYNCFKIIYSSQHQPKGILTGFKKFCSDENINFKVLSSVNSETISKGDLYFILKDKDLISLIKFSKEQKFQINKDYGIISYNETMLKEIIEGGITTISTDFNIMGEKISHMIINNSKNNIANISKIKVRNSL